jgi:hypothetical protein
LRSSDSDLQASVYAVFAAQGTFLFSDTEIREEVLTDLLEWCRKNQGELRESVMAAYGAAGKDVAEMLLAKLAPKLERRLSLQSLSSIPADESIQMPADEECLHLALVESDSPSKCRFREAYRFMQGKTMPLILDWPSGQAVVCRRSSPDAVWQPELSGTVSSFPLGISERLIALQARFIKCESRRLGAAEFLIMVDHGSFLDDDGLVFQVANEIP